MKSEALVDALAATVAEVKAETISKTLIEVKAQAVGGSSGRYSSRRGAEDNKQPSGKVKAKAIANAQVDTLAEVKAKALVDALAVKPKILSENRRM